jgi:hypothetical protein
MTAPGNPVQGCTTIFTTVRSGGHVLITAPYAFSR